MMAAVKGRNTKYEVALRKRLFSKGFRYRVNSRKLPGRPDIVLSKHKVVIFVNGCFWHYHKCHLSRIPKTRSEWWQKKLEGNRQRDSKNLELLMNAGWRILIIWECSFRHPGVSRETEYNRIIEIATDFILSDASRLEISFDENKPAST